MGHQRLCHAVRKQIAQADIDNKPGERFRRCFFASECKHSIQQVAENTSEKIIGRRRNPVAEVEYVIEYEHNSCSEQRICHTN